MSFTINDANLPATLTAQPMTDEELTAEGDIIVMAPRYTLTGASNAEIVGQLGAWAREDRRGVGCDPSTGFVLPSGARRSPDVSWTLKTRIMNMDARQRKGFWHLCPDFVIEVRSASDRLQPIQEKIREYLENGAQRGWLIDIENRSVEIYRPDHEVETRSAIDSIEGEGSVAGFVLDLTYVWDPLAD